MTMLDVKKTKLRRIVATTMLLLLLAYAGSYVFVANSKAARTAKEFMHESEPLQERIGYPVTATLSPLNFDLSFSGKSGRATLGYAVSGAKGAGHATLTLSKHESEWKVISAALSQQGAAEQILLR